jgi:hypothetical protein
MALTFPHRAWSASSIYVVARTRAFILDDRIAPRERYRTGVAFPVERPVERPGDEAVDDRRIFRFVGIFPHLVGAARRIVPCVAPNTATGSDRKKFS